MLSRVELLRKWCQTISLLALMWSSQGLFLATSFPSLKNSITESKNHEDLATTSINAYETPSLESFKSSKTLEMSNIVIQTSEPFSNNIPSLKTLEVLKTSEYNLFSSSLAEELDTTSLTNSFIKSSTLNIDPISSDVFYSSSIESTINGVLLSSLMYGSSALSRDIPSPQPEIRNSLSIISHFHTPLMSLFVAPTTVSWQTAPSLTTIALNKIAHSLTTSTSNNEATNPNHLPVPIEPDHKKLLMLVLRAEDCTKFSKADFEKMLGKLMTKFGFNDVIPEVSNAKCYSHLNINVTVGNPTPTLRFLPNMDGKTNYTVDVLNRTFRIIKLEKVDLRLEKTKSNSSSNVIAAVADHESVAYIAVGVSFGLILVICVSVCCIKCCCLEKSPKRYGVPKGTHVRLRPEDYTLTPIPRPSSIYVDYYRGSAAGDIFSTTSAGSITSTTPTVEQGVVQPFDTSIVPLEDSCHISSRDPSVESVPVQSDLKTFNINSLSGKAFRAVPTDSKEQLNPKAHSKKVEIKTGVGVTNPTFQRY